MSSGPSRRLVGSSDDWIIHVRWSVYVRVVGCDRRQINSHRIYEEIIFFSHLNFLLRLGCRDLFARPVYLLLSVWILIYILPRKRLHLLLGIFNISFLERYQEGGNGRGGRLEREILHQSTVSDLHNPINISLFNGFWFIFLKERKM